MSAVIYHNPRCSKSRQTLELIRSQGMEPLIIEYLKTPPTAEDLESLLSLLEIEPRDLMRQNESIYKEASLNDPALDHTALIAAMVNNPILIERPIVIANGKAVIARPPEKVLEILRT